MANPGVGAGTGKGGTGSGETYGAYAPRAETAERVCARVASRLKKRVSDKRNVGVEK